MRILFDYFIDLSDKRNQLIKEYLLKKGEKVFAYQKENIHAKENSVFIFPPSKKFLLEEIHSLPNNIIIFSGNINNEIKSLFDKKGITYFNFLEDEEFTYKNALLTAEGTLSIILSKSNKSIFEKEILILGFGRIGKALSFLLSKLNVNFSIATFNQKEYDESIIYTKNRFFEKSFDNFLNKYDVIINTIPKEFFTTDEVNKIDKNALFIELASISSINESIEKQFIYEHASGLPQKTTLITATNIMIEQLEKKLWKKL
ncbi:MAG: hypothetical protein E7342_03525 [Clostridiales bacterium]|nr:hypothetical protein [Clostridiales bacterium]